MWSMYVTVCPNAGLKKRVKASVQTLVLVSLLTRGLFGLGGRYWLLRFGHLTSRLLRDHRLRYAPYKETGPVDRK